MKFLIWSWDYGTDSGGGIALHRLAHNLVMAGQDARLACRSTAPGWYGQCCGAVREAAPEQVVIYPEIVEGNPFHAQRVVRWILNTPGAFGPGNGDGVYGPNDLVMYWEREFLGPFPTYKLGGQLQAWRPLDHFRDRHEPRTGRCYLVRKGRGKPINEPMESFCIDDYAQRGGDDYLIEVFNRVEHFVCYDNRCLIPTLANLCGVPQIDVIDGLGPMSRAEVLAATDRSIEQTREFVRMCEDQWR